MTFAPKVTIFFSSEEGMLPHNKKKNRITGRNWLNPATKGSYLIFKPVGGGSDVSRLLNGFRNWRLFNQHNFLCFCLLREFPSKRKFNFNTNVFSEFNHAHVIRVRIACNLSESSLLLFMTFFGYFSQKKWTNVKNPNSNTFYWSSSLGWDNKTHTHEVKETRSEDINNHRWIWLNFNTV